jgi:hypothetical protein
LNILKKHAGDRAETYLKEAFDNSSIPLPDNTVFSELNTAYENKYQNRRNQLNVNTDFENTMITIRTFTPAIAFALGLATTPAWMVFFAIGIGVSITSLVTSGVLPFILLVGIGTGIVAAISERLLFALPTLIGQGLANVNNKSELKEHYLICQGRMDNLEGLTEIFRDEAPSIKQEHAKEIKALFMNEAFEQSNSTGIQKIRRAIEERPFMSSNFLLDLIQSTFRARNNQAKIPGFFCKLNRADDIQALYDLTKDANFDLSVNAEDRTALIERLTSIIENHADDLDEKTPLLNNLIIYR